MKTLMTSVNQCAALSCSFNKDSRCHAMAINVGGPEACPSCDTFFTTNRKSGIQQMNAGVGACKVESCKFNELFTCAAAGIQVQLHQGHPDCATYVSAT